jgi:hypothetical protein
MCFRFQQGVPIATNAHRKRLRPEAFIQQLVYPRGRRRLRLCAACVTSQQD